MNDKRTERFGGNVPEVTMKTIHELIDRKREESRCKALSFKVSVSMLLMIVFVFVYTMMTKSDLFRQFSLDAIREAFDDPVIWIMAIGVFAVYVYLQHATKQYEEADEDYESLRSEMIDRCDEFFSEPDEWNNRHLVFQVLQEKYDINLYHK